MIKKGKKEKEIASRCNCNNWGYANKSVTEIDLIDKNKILITSSEKQLIKTNDIY